MSAAISLQGSAMNTIAQRRRATITALESHLSSEGDWLDRFHRGDKALIGEVYCEQQGAVLAVARRYLTEAEAEACAHDVFLRMVQKRSFRENYQGGSLRAWLCTVTRNRAIDIVRRQGRMEKTEPQDLERLAGAVEGDRFVQAAEARRVVDTFRREVLPEKWRGVFDQRFIHQRSQREAAGELQMRRSTLAYQEGQIRSLLEQHLLSTAQRGQA